MYAGLNELSNEWRVKRRREASAIHAPRESSEKKAEGAVSAHALVDKHRPGNIKKKKKKKKKLIRRERNTRGGAEQLAVPRPRYITKRPRARACCLGDKEGAARKKKTA